MPRKRVHLVCNAHLDPVWLWEWEEGAAAAIATFRTAADLCDEYTEYIFNHNEVTLYQWVEEYEPELFERIQKLVAAGRWHVMGGWYLQPDCNMPAGESFVRQILVGKSYFADKFGVEPTTAINFDPFGHTRGLVQILAKSGYDSYLFMRPDANDLDLPNHDFVWEGFDGSRVLVTRIHTCYSSPLGKIDEKVAGWCDVHPDPELGLLPWGVGNHGGGPSRIDLSKLRTIREESTDVEFIHSTPEAYFAELNAKRDQLPVINKGLNPWAVGCYTSQVRIKQRHRQLENELFATEKICTTASLHGLIAYPAEELHRATCDLLAAQFHDILPGSSIQPVEETSIRLMDHALEELSRIKARAFFALAKSQPAPAEGEVPILVHNPHPYPVRTQIVCEFSLADQMWDEQFTVIHLRQGDREIPAQIEKELSNIALDWRKRAVFEAELAPSQVNRFDGKLHVLPRNPEPQLNEHNGMFHFRGDGLEVTINTRTGLVDRLRIAGRDYVTRDGFAPTVMKDNQDAWGMSFRRFTTVAGQFERMTNEKAHHFSGLKGEPRLPAVRVIEDGPVRSVIEALLSFGDSFICQRYKLPKQGTAFEVEVRVYWNEKDRALKLVVPTNLTHPRYLGQTAFGINELPTDGEETVAQQWVMAASNETGRALTCINDGVYGSDFVDGAMRLTLLRSPAYSGHPIQQRPVTPNDRFTPRIDQGERLFRFRFNGGSMTERLEAIGREAGAFNEKPYALSFSPAGMGDPALPGIILSDDVVQLTAFKRAHRHDDNSYIVRLFEPTGAARSTTVTIPAIKVATEVQLAGFEIKTLRIDAGTMDVTEVNLLERPS